MQADALLGPSPAIERELIAAGYPRDRIRYLPNGVAVRPPRQASERQEARRALAEADGVFALAPDAPLVVYTGRLHEMKGLDHLLSAWPAVLARHPGARLWLVGEGPFRPRLIEQIENLGLSTSVLLAGLYDDVEDFLLAADVFVLPSLEEGMSLALLEAMAAGLPVVASSIAANALLVEDGRQGRLVAPGDSAALAAALAGLLEQPDAAARLGSRARERVEARFSIARMVEAHLELFDRLLERRKTPA
jgi:glycosyltransferase involved in cell wall biosynthesis